MSNQNQTSVDEIRKRIMASRYDETEEECNAQFEKETREGLGDEEKRNYSRSPVHAGQAEYQKQNSLLPTKAMGMSSTGHLSSRDNIMTRSVRYALVRGPIYAELSQCYGQNSLPGTDAQGINYTRL